jgi:leucyl-tRNA synthetase
VQVGNEKATLNGWPDKVRLMQENWIGKSAGVRFAFTHDIKGADGQLIRTARCMSSPRVPTPSWA